MKRKIFYIVFYFLAAFFSGCSEEPPTGHDGTGELVLYSLWDTSSVAGVQKLVPMSNAKVILISEYGTMIRYTDETGKLALSHLPAATYDISVKKNHPVDNNILLCGSVKSLRIGFNEIVNDTVYTTPFSSFGISINEIYSAGPINNVFYFYDQFIELYNSSDEIKYLDGMMISRVSGNNEGKGPGADENDDGDIDGINYVFKFPGKPGEKNYPLLPKEFIVLAGDAVDHRSTCSSAINLNNADWEFFNQFAPEDVDNKNVKNLINLRADKTADFLISLTSDIIVITTGTDSVYTDGFDISTIIDGVEYQSSSSTLKTLDARIDRSYALCPGKYSGRSFQRREPGLDTNDGLLDWEILSTPTPGYQR